MNIKLTLFLLYLLIAFCVFTYKSFKILPYEYDKKLIRRLYYLFVVFNIYIVISLFHNELTIIETFISNDISNKNINLLLIFCFLFLISIFWEYIFVSCRTFKFFKFKDLEFEIEERENVKYIDKFQEKEIFNLYSVLNCKTKLLKYIDYYIDNNDLNPEESYENVINEYSKRRKNIKIHIFTKDQSGLDRMQVVLKLTHQQISSILYPIDMYGFCNPKNFRKKDYLFAEIKTKYLENNFIIVLISDFLINKEHLAVIDIINYLELKLDLEIANTINLESVTNS